MCSHDGLSLDSRQQQPLLPEVRTIICVPKPSTERHPLMDCRSDRRASPARQSPGRGYLRCCQPWVAEGPASGEHEPGGSAQRERCGAGAGSAGGTAAAGASVAGANPLRHLPPERGRWGRKAAA